MNRLRQRLYVRALEDRTAPATFTVLNLNDSGADSLRDCVSKANAAAGADTIGFSGGLTGTITLTSGEIAISGPVAITGPGTHLIVSGNDAQRLFNISSAPAATAISFSGLTLTGGFTSGLFASGSAIAGNSQSLNLTKCAFTNNNSSGFSGTGIGGAIVLTGGSLTADNCLFTGNSATNRGGALAIQGTGAKLTLNGCTVSGNSSGDGGGVYVNSNLSVQNSTISGNTASGGGVSNSGGGILAFGPFAAGITIVNSTFSGNSAFAGGGIALNNSISSTTLTIRNSTITANSAGNLGGGIARMTGVATVVMESSIVSGNTNATSPDIYSLGSVSVKSSAIGSGTGFTKTDLGGNLAFGTNLKLGPLANNGGTTLTHLPAIDSPLIGVGSNPAALTTDQRGAGFARVIGSPDMGAVETRVLKVVNTNDSGTGSLRQAIADANAQFGVATVTFDATVFASAKTIVLTTGEMAITRGVTINGPAAKVTINGNAAGRIFNTSGELFEELIQLSKLTLTNGKAAGGGAILMDDEVVELKSCAITNSTSTTNGGAIRASGTTGIVLIEDSTLTGNIATFGGGAIGLDHSTAVTVRRSTLAANIAGSSGGAIEFDNIGNLTVEDSTLSGNTANSLSANGGGGAIYVFNAASKFLISNSTLSANKAPVANGGAVCLVSSSGAMTFQNCTITGNSAGTNGGGIARINLAGVFTLNSTIIAGNTNANSADMFFSSGGSGNVPGDNNLIGVADVGNFTLTGTGNLTGTKAVPLDAKLGPLANNGGPTQTHAPLNGSPALDKGSNPAALAFDQRGLNRVSGLSADIGAVEVNPQTFIVDQPVDENDGNFAKGDLSLREALGLANEYPSTADTITFATNSLVDDPFDFIYAIKLTLGQLSIVGPTDIIWVEKFPLTISANNASRVLKIDAAPAGTPINLTGLRLANGKDLEGGGILAGDEQLTLTRCVFTGHTSTSISNTSGGAIAMNGDGTITAIDCEFTGNFAGGAGGAIFNQGDTFLTRCTVAGNTAHHGGGLYSGNDLTIDSCAIFNNVTSTDAGGGVYVSKGPATIRNSTISGNTAMFAGGIAIGFDFTGTLLVQNSTIVNNVATSQGGGILRISNVATITVTSSIVSGNSAPLGPDVRQSTGAVNVNFSAIGNSSGFNLTGANNLPFGTDLKLGALQINGGTTATHALLAGSPAVDKGSNPAALTSDQRGTPYLRTVGSLPDIGAYETAKVIMVTNTNDSGAGSLRLAIFDANFTVNPELVRFDPAVFSTKQTIALTSGRMDVYDFLEIQGPGAGLLTITANNTSGLFQLGFTSPTDTVLSGLTLTGGKSSHGGAIDAGGQTTVIRDCVLTGNSATVGGGAIAVNVGTLIMERCTVANNSAVDYGGGIYFFSRSSFNITDSTISGNKCTSGEGGGIYFFNASYAPIVLRNSTISGNSAALAGGGIALNFRGNLVAQNSTITQNTSAKNGGGIGRFGGQGDVTLQSTIVAQNNGSGGPDIDFNVALGTVFANNSLIGVANAGLITIVGANNKTGTSTTPLDAKLSALGSFGGSTQTHLLLPGSPAIDAGSNAVGMTKDQRGLGRVFGAAADIGAVEDQPLTIIVDVLADENDGNFAKGDLSLREAVFIANSNCGNDTITFDAAVFVSTQAIILSLGEIAFSEAATVIGLGTGLVTINANNASRVFSMKTAPNNSTFTIENLTVTGGSATTGGGIYAAFNNLNLTNCVISGNKATQLGAGVDIVGKLTATNCLFTLNSGGASAIRINGTAVLTQCTISGNTASHGGGISIYGFLTVDSCAITGNTATGSTGGGGIEQTSLLFSSFRNSTISGNTASSGMGGGVLFTHAGAFPEFQNCTITNNSAATGGGIASKLGSGSIDLESSIVSGNTATVVGPDLYTPGAVTTLHSLIGSAAGVTTFTPDSSTTANLGKAPLLAALANNGGPTMTHALLPGSPAINTGANTSGSAFDQRGIGFPRSIGGTDIGAFEVQTLLAKITSVQIDDGSAQRSRITSLTITFDQPPTLPMSAADGFQLKRQSDNAMVSLNAAPSGNVVTLTFTGGVPFESGSLADGRYTLTALASQITNLDGDGNGTAGNDFVLASAQSPSPPTNIFRLFGDDDGDGTVAANDFIQFRLALGGNNPTFDFDNDGAVAASDFIQFRVRFGGSI